MIYFLTALYYEAKDIISHYKMKKVMKATKFQVFQGENELLIISGTSTIKAIVAATYLLNYFECNENDIFINLGICGAAKNNSYKGEIFLCNKLIDSYSKKTFYPDMLFRHPFNEGSLESFSQVIDEKKRQNINADIVDQEGAFVYQAVLVFFKPDNIHIIKIVSDLLNPDSVTPQEIEKLMSDNMTKVYTWLEDRTKIEFENEDIINIEEYNILKLLSEKMKLTSAMNIEIEKLSRQYKIRNGHFIDIIKEYTKFQYESKNEGKRTFGKLKNRLMEL